MRYYVITGEASGDLHAANCIRELLKIDPAAEIAFTGGERMEAVTKRKADIHIAKMAFMGFVDVARHALQIRENFKVVKQRIVDFRPDLILLVDYPGFNLRMAAWAHRQGFRVDYYISPTVWAWKADRVEKIRKFTHKLFVILPFEEQFYAARGHKVHFVGHPLVDEVAERKKGFRSRGQFIADNRLPDLPIVAVLPGSRKQEVERMLGIMTSVVNNFPGFRFVIAAAGNLGKKYYEQFPAQGIDVLHDQTQELMHFAAAGIIKSGTSTLEAALMRLPQVVCYKGGALSFAIGKRLVKVKFISLVNLIMDREVVKELIQNDLTAENITLELRRILSDDTYRSRILSDYDEMEGRLGAGGASRKVATMLREDAAEVNQTVKS